MLGQIFANSALRLRYFQPGLGVGLDCLDRAFRFGPAIDAFVGMDDEHVFALVEAIHGAHLDAVHVLHLMQASLTT